MSTLKAESTLYRVYKRGGHYPTLWSDFRFFGPTGSRFDHHLRDENDNPSVQERGICYLATDVPTALAEVFQHDRTVDRKRDEPWLVAFKLNCDLTLLDLSDTFAVKAGGSMKMVSGTTAHSQNWSRGFYDVYETCDGIQYPSSMTNRTCVALYERAGQKKAFPPHPTFHRALADPVMLIPLRNAVRDIGYKGV